MHARAASGRALTGAAGMLAMASSSGSDQMDKMVNRFSNLLHVDSLNLARASGIIIIIINIIIIIRNE